MRWFSRRLLAILVAGQVTMSPFQVIAAAPKEPPSAGRELVLGLRIAPPFAMKTADGIWTGITVELWRHLAQELSLRFRLQETTQEELFQSLAKGSLDGSAGALTVTGDRLRQVDFTLPYLTIGLGVAVPAARALDWAGIARSFLSVSFLSIVFGIAGVLAAVSVIVWLLERRHTKCYAGPPLDGLICSVSWSVQAMASRYPSPLAPATRLGRLLAGVWMAASVALIAMFTAAITSHLTSREVAGLVQKAGDLHDVRVGTVSEPVAISYLDREGIHHWDFATVEDGLRALASGEIDALVHDKPLLAWLVRRDYPNVLKTLDLNLDPQSYAIALPFGSPLRQSLNVALAERTRAVWWRELIGRYMGLE